VNYFTIWEKNKTAIHNVAIKVAIPISVATAGLAVAQSPTKPTFFYSRPSELQFSCAVSLNAQEEALVSKLSMGSIEERCAAARDLWKGHSCRYAGRVVEFTIDSASESAPMAALKRFVDESLKPEAILSEIREDNNLWGLWLACLRPHETLVPELLAELSKEPLNRPAVILALGKSGDKRALQPLLLLLEESDYRLPGDAANALGYMAFPEAEQKLIEALSTDNPWLKVNACSALGKIGSRLALPALHRIAADKRYTGAMSARSTASSAILAITKRNPKQAAPSNSEKPSN
jgi:hypothetical protein